MNLTDLISNPGFHHINEQIINDLNYQELISCCQASSTLDLYIRNHNFKWQLLQNLQELKLKTKNLHGFVPDKLFTYYETNGTINDLSLLIDFLTKYSQDKASWDFTSPLVFAVCHKKIEFVKLLIPILPDFESSNVRKYSNFSLLHSAICTNDIQMVKLLLKYSKEKNLDIYHKTRYNIDDDLDFNEKETILELAIRLRFHEIAQLIEDVYTGKIEMQNL